MKSQNNMDPLESLRQLVGAVEKARADIAPGYAEYVQLAFAIATDCGEAGRPYFHRLCGLSPKYQPRHAERLFANALAQGRGDVHLGTAFHLAQRAGVAVERRVEEKNAENAGNAPSAFPHTRAHVSLYNEEGILYGSDPLIPLPTFPPHAWPYPLNEVLACAETEVQSDALLLGTFTVLGASLGAHVRSLYGGRFRYPCLQTFVVAPPASGKGVLAHVCRLIEPIHEELRRQTEERMKEYRKEKARYDSLGKERAKAEAPQMPPNRMFLISGNNTGTGILQNLIDADGTGLICETEADTVSTAIGTEYGHWSDILRKAFDHDRLAYNRRTDREYREVRRSCLAVLLSGTPAQVRPLIPSAENGLFSRQVFYYMPGLHQWQDQFRMKRHNLEEDFERLGKRWKKQAGWIGARGVCTLVLTGNQQEMFNRTLGKFFEQACLGENPEMGSSVARMGINLCRLCALTAILRATEGFSRTGEYPERFTGCEGLQPDAGVASDNLKDAIIANWALTMTDADFRAVMGLAGPLYRHALHVLSFLPATETKRRTNADSDRFFSLLPSPFTRQQLIETAGRLGMAPNTALSWLQRRLKRKTAETLSTGTYILRNRT